MEQRRTSTGEELYEPGLEAYAAAHSSPERAYFADLARETYELSPNAGMMVGTIEGRFLKMLVAMLQPKVVLEIGTFTGYSALSMAEALPPGGRVITCDISPETTAVARKYAERAGLMDRIEFRLGPALETIAGLDGPFDMVFIDADKGNLPNYYEAVLSKMPSGGVIVVDNVLWSGRVLEGRDDGHRDTAVLREFNAMVAQDERVETVMLTVRDGVTLIRKR